MKKIIFILVTTLFVLKIYAQHKEDSMLLLLPTQKADTNKVKLLYRIGDAYETNNDAKATYYYTEAYHLSTRLNFTKGIIRYYSSQGEILNMKGRYADCMELLKQGLSLAIKTSDKMREGIMYENMGNTFGYMEEIDSAVNYYFKSLGIFDTFNDTLKISNVYSDLSSIFIRSGKLENALAYSDTAIHILQQNRDVYLLAALTNREAILWKMKKYDKAQKLNNDIIQLAIELRDDWGLTDAMINNCNHNRDLGQYTQLKKNATELFTVAHRTNSNAIICAAYYWLSEADFYNMDFVSAKKNTETAITLAEKNNLTQKLKESYLLYSKIILALTGDVRTSELYATRADSIEQQTINEQVLKATQNAAEKYQTEKKDAQLKLQSAAIMQGHLWKYILSGSLLALLGISFVSLRSFRNKQKLLLSEKTLQEQKIIRLENEKQLAATQAVLKGQEEERSRLAKDLHDGLGGILSSVKYSFNNMKQQFVLSEDNARAFEKSMGMLDESIAELRRVAHNMMPETLTKLSLDEALQDYCRQITDSNVVAVTYQSFGMNELQTDNTVKITAYRIVQELMNNIMKHAAASKAVVKLIAKENTLHITVEDDGKGFDVQQLSYATGIGYKNMLSRVHYLKGKTDVQSTQDKGTSVYIEIPI
ncbi:MAG: sensor histidine kinase [Bacteroidetes bacterium]|nr:sensor histidine kinase [Bacteroidota bacterium]